MHFYTIQNGPPKSRQYQNIRLLASKHHDIIRFHMTIERMSNKQDKTMHSISKRIQNIPS